MFECICKCVGVSSEDAHENRTDVVQLSLDGRAHTHLHFIHTHTQAHTHTEGQTAEHFDWRMQGTNEPMEGSW